MNEQNIDSIKPSEFMRKIRPDCYSDSSDNIGYELDKASFDHFLETITSRNQTHDFESFCRKLCERTICPNLRPPTGPEGGGDSKADTETIPTAEEISAGWLVGHANGAKERWAFAISAKKKWSEKVRTDVKGIAETGRSYDKVFFITSRYARSKDRSRIEDELSEEYKTRIVILDRTWILEKTIDEGYLDLAYNYLGAGKEVRSNQLGPHDYSRKKLLAEIESNLNDPEYYVGMEFHKVTDLLLTARLSRNLELPRTETDGRFERVIRFAESKGTLHQQIKARYEKIWTAFWWYDDIETLKNSYDSFEQLSLESDYSKDVEYLCNLLQLLFNSLNHNLMSEEEAQLDERVNKLLHRLETLSTDSDRPNNALEAKTS
ncbi:MAG: tetratricopeptide repeat protein, partial [Candidatus Lokiarchaeota archaeon]|nr:tetratricopeptide repeat protein [Candidatus Lokiarchaeota archaeon]